MELKCQKKGDETTVTVTVQENESDKERLGVLSFEASGITEKVQIRQGVKEVVYTPYSEYYATQVAKVFGVDAIEYGTITQDKEPYT